MNKSKTSYNVNFPHGLMFHRFCKSKRLSLGIGALEKKDFERIINFVGKNRILNPEEWLQRMQKGKLENNHLCITFDDGLKSQIDIALPILNKFKIKAFWFLHSGIFFGNYDKNEIFNILIFKKFKKFKNFTNKFVHFYKLDTNIFKSKKFYNYLKRESKNYKFLSKSHIKYKYIRDFCFSKNKFENMMENFFKKYNLNINKFANKIWMNKKDVINLSTSGHMIGMHSFSHSSQMSKLSKNEQELEYKKNYNHLKSICKKKIITMSHPLNSYNHTTLKILKKMGTICGFRANTQTNNKKINSSFLEFAREDPANILK